MCTHACDEQSLSGFILFIVLTAPPTRNTDHPFSLTHMPTGWESVDQRTHVPTSCCHASMCRITSANVQQFRMQCADVVNRQPSSLVRRQESTMCDIVMDVAAVTHFIVYQIHRFLTGPYNGVDQIYKNFRYKM